MKKSFHKKLRMYLVIFTLCGLIISSSGTRIESIIRENIKTCRGKISFKCSFMANRCYTNTIYKREAGYLPNFLSTNDNSIGKYYTRLVKHRLRIHVTCSLCRRIFALNLPKSACKS
ncbi:uncharacterized protein LOC143465362 isoform X1 [Clavelina lepadiformis]|uniref:uncharacterized protein LOC143465362 isoform X1 n=1 Tax=Clavelina lepadiformis TaxID=159417 RepID=UPI004041A165